MRLDKSDIHLFHGDCLEVMSELPDNSIDMVLTDPPYGVTACKWDSVIHLETMWHLLKRITADGAVMVFTAMQPFSSALVMSCPQWFRQSLVWCKNKPTGHLNANRRHLTRHEDVLVFCSKTPVYHPQKTETDTVSHKATRSSTNQCYGHLKPTAYEGTTSRYPSTVLEFPVVNNDGSHGKRLHPTQKPVALMEYLIKTYTNKGDRVLDFAMGSGTTGVACINTDRKFTGIELDKQYFDIASNRIQLPKQQNG